MRKIGIELEFSDELANTSYDELENKIKTIVHANGQSFSRSEHNARWTLKGEHCGYELTSPAMEATQENFQKIHNVVDQTRQIFNGRNVIRRNCGFHVHLDISDYTRNEHHRSLINLFRCYEPCLLSILPASRTGNDYVRRLGRMSGLSDLARSNNILENVSRYDLNDHMLALNYSRYNSSRKTVEVRYAAGTMKPRKVVNWTRLMAFIAEAAKLKNYVFIPGCQLEGFKEFVRSTETNTWLDSGRRELVSWIQQRADDRARRDLAVQERRSRQNA